MTINLDVNQVLPDPFKTCKNYNLKNKNVNNNPTVPL